MKARVHFIGISETSVPLFLFPCFHLLIFNEKYVTHLWGFATVKMYLALKTESIWEQWSQVIFYNLGAKKQN